MFFSTSLQQIRIPNAVAGREHWWARKTRLLICPFLAALARGHGMKLWIEYKLYSWCLCHLWQGAAKLKYAWQMSFADTETSPFRVTNIKHNHTSVWSFALHGSVSSLGWGGFQQLPPAYATVRTEEFVDPPSPPPPAPLPPPVSSPTMRPKRHATKPAKLNNHADATLLPYTGRARSNRIRIAWPGGRCHFWCSFLFTQCIKIFEATSGPFLGDCAWFLSDLKNYIPAKMRPQNVAAFF